MKTRVTSTPTTTTYYSNTEEFLLVLMNVIVADMYQGECFHVYHDLLAPNQSMTAWSELVGHFFPALKINQRYSAEIYTKAAIEMVRQGTAVIYDTLRTSSALSAELQAERAQEDHSFGIKLKIPYDSEIILDDLIYDYTTHKIQENDLIVLRYPYGTPTIYFCNVIDDITHKVTCVIRDKKNINFSLNEILIHLALESPLPLYGHLSLSNDQFPYHLLSDHKINKTPPEVLINSMYKFVTGGKHLQSLKDLRSIPRRPASDKLTIFEVDLEMMNQFFNYSPRNKLKFITPFFPKEDENDLLTAISYITQEPFWTMVRVKDFIRKMVTDVDLISTRNAPAIISEVQTASFLLESIKISTWRTEQEVRENLEELTVVYGRDLQTFSRTLFNALLGSIFPVQIEDIILTLGKSKCIQRIERYIVELEKEIDRNILCD